MSTRTEILRAASRIVAKQGLSGATTRAICDAAAITAPTLYHHFGDKKGLIDALLADAFAKFLASKRTVETSKDPVENLRRHWDNYVEFGTENPELYGVIYAPVEKGALPAAGREATRLLLMLIGEIALAGRLAKSLNEAAQMFAATIHGVTALRIARPDMPWTPQFATDMREMVLREIVLPASAAGRRMSMEDLLRSVDLILGA